MKGIFNAIWFFVFWATVVPLTMFIGAIPLAVLLFCTYAGAQVRAQKAEKIVKTTLMKDEQLLAQAIQHRVFALWSRRKTIAITTSRIILITRGLVGGFKMSDIQWKDLKDAKLEQNVLDSICGSNLQFQHYNAGVGWMGIDGDVTP
ncbi:PH domain-containing protein [Brevundimonas sp.]|uniref:PH domain-containing protein n=1 Tax=Brevundimonas sp. TaxID=1871086 RepID=UPI0028A5F0CA|nr:PH domain-containing protein [Brevundimonas sp.]